MVHYSNLLITKREELLRSAPRKEDIIIERSADDMDALQGMNERDLVVHHIDHDASTLRAVNEALARVANGTFGICVVCDEEVSNKRLNAQPWAARCIRCQEEFEHNQKIGKSDDTEDFLKIA